MCVLHLVRCELWSWAPCSSGTQDSRQCASGHSTGARSHGRCCSCPLASDPVKTLTGRGASGCHGCFPAGGSDGEAGGRSFQRECSRVWALLQLHTFPKLLPQNRRMRVVDGTPIDTLLRSVGSRTTLPIGRLRCPHRQTSLSNVMGQPLSFSSRAEVQSKSTHICCNDSISTSLGGFYLARSRSSLFSFYIFVQLTFSSLNLIPCFCCCLLGNYIMFVCFIGFP